MTETRPNPRTLIDRLRGRYGTEHNQTEFHRQFGAEFIPAIQIEAANRILELEAQLYPKLKPKSEAISTSDLRDIIIRIDENLDGQLALLCSITVRSNQWDAPAAGLNGSGLSGHDPQPQLSKWVNSGNIAPIEAEYVDAREPGEILKIACTALLTQWSVSGPVAGLWRIDIALEWDGEPILTRLA